jgi:hypothetical protein
LRPAGRTKKRAPSWEPFALYPPMSRGKFRGIALESARGRWVETLIPIIASCHFREIRFQANRAGKPERLRILDIF